MQAVDHLASFPDNYIQYMDTEILTFEAYLENMRRPEEYGDHFTLLALTREYNVQALVVSNQGKHHARIISNSENEIYDPDLPVLTFAYFPEGQGEHYMSIAVRDDYLHQLLRRFTAEIEDSADEDSVHGEDKTPMHDSNAESLHDEDETPRRDTDEKSVHDEDENPLHETDKSFVCDDENPLHDDDERHAEYLPKEIQEKILCLCLDSDPSSRFTLQTVNKFWYNVVQKIPHPRFHIGEDVLEQIPWPVSVRQLSRAAGQGSGLMLAIKRAINNRRWWNSWLYLQPEFLRNIQLRGVRYGRN